MLTSCDDQITEEQLLGKWYTKEALQASEPRPSFEFQSGQKVLSGGETYTYERGAQNVFTFKLARNNQPNGQATFAFDPDGEELTISSSQNAPLKNGKYYQIGATVDQSDSTAIPSAYPPGGIYTEGQSVTLSTTTSGATIKYTTGTNAGDPINGTTYSSPILISSTTTLRAIAVKDNVYSDELFQEYTISSSSSSSSNITSNADAGEGSLRAAIAAAQDGDTITLNLSGNKTISLKSCIDITKNIIIEGGSAVITRDSTWPDNISGSFFEIKEGKTVSINRVHFKGGRELNASFGLGGAIYNIGTLTVTSCIFNDNRANYGGAIYTTSKSLSTTVRGCTFYNNTATKWGGAIFVGGGSLFLTGNLFYGNTATDWGPIVDQSTAVASAKVYSRGYNVVDKEDGTGKTQCGWTSAEGDQRLGTGSLSSLTTVPFNVTTFEPSTTLKNFITTTPAGFPSTDFNGATRNGVPGAVNATN
ncbi:chitobiase/beta-hexosaminidase C-terminal domain-containing protein [Treponema sp. R80B11-R83G3]